MGVSRADGQAGMSATLQRVVANCPTPVLLLSRDPSTTAIRPPIGTIAVPASSTRTGRAAQDVAFAFAAHIDADVHAIHVVTTPPPHGGDATPVRADDDDMLAGSTTIAAAFGRTATLHRAHGPMPGRALAAPADRVGADMIVMGVDADRGADRVFVGYDAEYLLSHARQTVALVILPH